MRAHLFIIEPDDEEHSGERILLMNLNRLERCLLDVAIYGRVH